MQLSDAITLFLKAHDAKTTVKSYGWILRKFNVWLDADAELSALTTEDLQRYYDSHLVEEKQYAPRSLHLHWMALTGLCKWLHRCKHIAANPMPDIELPRPKSAIRKRLSHAEVRQLLLQCEREPDPYHRALVRVIVTTLTTTAVRHDELIQIKIEDIDLDDCFLTIEHGKGDKTRDVPLCDQCIRALRAWLAVRPSDTQHPYLLTHDRKRRVSYDHINKMLKRLAHLAGFSEEQISRCLAHACRRFCATNLHRNKVEIDAIRVFLGHSSIATTQIYLHTDEERLFSIRNASEIDLEEKTAESSIPATTEPISVPPSPARDIAAPGQDKRLSHRKSIRLPR